MEYLSNWKFWLAVLAVVFISHLVLSYVMPKFSAGGSVKVS